MLIEIPVYLDEPVNTPAVIDSSVLAPETSSSNEVVVEATGQQASSAASKLTAGTVQSLHAAEFVSDATAGESSLTANQLVADPAGSIENSNATDDEFADGDDIEMLAAARQGIKRRWSFEENTVFKRAFQDALLNKKMPSGKEILSVSKEIKTRTVAQIRTRLNNIMLGKQKLFS